MYFFKTTVKQDVDKVFKIYFLTTLRLWNGHKVELLNTIIN